MSDMTTHMIYGRSPDGLEIAVGEQVADSPVAALEAWAHHIDARDGWSIDSAGDPPRIYLCLPRRGFYYTYA